MVERDVTGSDSVETGAGVAIEFVLPIRGADANRDGTSGSDVEIARDDSMLNGRNDGVNGFSELRLPEELTWSR